MNVYCIYSSVTDCFINRKIEDGMIRDYYWCSEWNILEIFTVTEDVVYCIHKDNIHTHLRAPLEKLLRFLSSSSTCNIFADFVFVELDENGPNFTTSFRVNR